MTFEERMVVLQAIQVVEHGLAGYYGSCNEKCPNDVTPINNKSFEDLSNAVKRYQKTKERK